ncbi:hypothetical protein [Mucilaginibacter antarcticus]|uniref:Uncharacterized protein n=1 Tax=Mucilaginibacter antarcticus TaxID=1855725 RepID=A0ABW5XSM9_9SPHI
MKKLVSVMLLSVFTLGSLYAAPVQDRKDTTKTKKDTTKVKKNWRDTTIKKDTIKPR